MTLELWQQRLQDRGILDAALAAGWTSLDWYATPGWKYPLYGVNGEQWTMPKEAGPAAGRTAQRWKALDSNHQPKYLWGYPDQSKERGDLRQPPKCQYYWLPGGDVQTSVGGDDGTLYLAGGEPDMLTLATVGKRNVTAFFGEGVIPENLLDVLKQLAVKRVLYYPNNDHTGWDVAQKLYTLFEVSGGAVSFDAYGLPDEHNWNPINDLNDLWRATAFNRDEFLAVLAKCPPIRFLAEAQIAASQNTDNSAEWEAYHAEIERALGATWQRGRGWSKPLACIFADHTHDDQHPKAAYHKEKHIFRCPKCAQSWTGDETANRLGIERPKLPDRTQPFKAPLQKPLPAVVPSISIYSSDDSLKRYKERLRGLVPMEHVPFPFHALHHLDGFCRVVPLGKLIGVLGLSGGGKTSFIETLTDAWRQLNFNVLWWGPEWTWEEMADRSVQRYGGLSMLEMAQHEMWLDEIRRGVPLPARMGREFTQECIDRTDRVVDQVMDWGGKAYYLDKMDVSLDRLLMEAQVKVDDLASDGCKPKIAVFDYIQLAEITGARSDNERIPRAVSLIKAFVIDNRMIGVLATQPRKSDSEDARKDGELLTAEAAQYFRDDKTNLFITLNPAFDDEGNMTGEGWINVVKNSGGRRGKVAAKPDPRFLRWQDAQFRSTDRIIQENGLAL